MTPAAWAMGWAAGLLMAGLAGIVSALAGHQPQWTDLYIFLPIFVTGTGLGWMAGAGLEFETWRQRQAVSTRLEQARAYALEVETELKMQPVATVETPATPPDTTDAWRLAIETFLLAGEAQGFSARRMAGVVGSDTWPMLTKLLEEHGILSNLPGRGYGWASEMTLARALTQVRAGALHPYPDSVPPVVNWSYNSAATRNSGRRAATVVIDNANR
jgi:hypothetical protein